MAHTIHTLIPYQIISVYDIKVNPANLSASKHPITAPGTPREMLTPVLDFSILVYQFSVFNKCYLRSHNK
jgi:hypothetical protein